MAGKISDDDEPITDINMTPMVDVMLVLLVIFMVTTTVIVQRSIGVKLPKADTAQDKITTKNLGFTLDKASVLYLDGKTVTYEELPALIETYKQKATAEGLSLQALITADESTPHGSVIKLIDNIRKNGITEFAIHVEGKNGN